jgi:hypothetical protein
MILIFNQSMLNFSQMDRARAYEALTDVYLEDVYTDERVLELYAGELEWDRQTFLRRVSFVNSYGI